MAFYSSSSESVSSSMSSSESSSEDGHIQAIKRLESCGMALGSAKDAPNVESFESLPPLEDLVLQAPSSMPTQCHKPWKHRHGKEVEEEADEASEMGTGDLAFPPAELACGICPRGRARKEAKDGKMDARFDSPLQRSAVRDTIILPAVTAISAPLPKPASSVFANIVLPETVPIKSTATKNVTNVAAPKTQLASIVLPETVRISSVTTAKKATNLASAQTRMDSFANIVLPETVPINTTTIKNAQLGTLTTSTTSTTTTKGLDNFAHIILPETVPINTPLSAPKTMESSDLGEWRGDRKHHNHHHHHNNSYYERYGREESSPFYPFWAKNNTEGGALHAPKASELKDFVTKNFPAKPITVSSSTSSSSSSEDYEPLRSASKAIGRLHYHQGVIDSLLREFSQYASTPIHTHSAVVTKPTTSAAPLATPVQVKSEVSVSDYKARPITVAFPNTQLSSLATKLAIADTTTDQSLRSLLLNGQLGANLAAPMTLDCKTEKQTQKMSIFKHLMKYHHEFYALLRDNDLLLTLEETTDLALFVPDVETLTDVTNRVSEETANVLRYHAVIVPVDEPIRDLTDMTEFETLRREEKVQIEKREDSFYINGHHFKSDTVLPLQLFHIKGFLSPSQLSYDTPPADAPPSPPDDGATGDNESTTDTTTTTNPADLPPPSNAVGGEDDQSGEDTASTTSTQTSILTVPTAAVTLKGYNKEKTVTVNTAIGCIASTMSKSFYTAQMDMKSYTDTSFVAVNPATLTFRTYNTDSLFEAYQAKQLTDIVRLRSETLAGGAGVVIETRNQRRLDIGNSQCLTEFAVDATKTTLKKADLLAGLTEISFPAPGETGKVCVVKCGIQRCDAVDANTYLSTDECVLLRFKNSTLDTVSVNMERLLSGASLASEAHTGNHFLELFTTAERRQELYGSAMDKDAFNAMLLGESRVTKFVNKQARVAKKKIGRATRKALTSGEREVRKRSALKVHAIKHSAVPLSVLEAAEEATKSLQNTLVTLIVRDKQYEVDPGLSLENVVCDKFFYTVEGEKFAGYRFPPKNGLGAALGQGKTGQYLEVKTSLEMVAFNFSAVTISVSDAYYAVRGSTCYVLVFDASGQLVRMVNMLKRTKLIKGLQL